jgi:hypothetical protein
MISLEHVRALLTDPPAVVAGRVTAFCDFAGPGDQSVLALCEGNVVQIVDAWVHRNTMHSVGKFLSWFRKRVKTSFFVTSDHRVTGSSPAGSKTSTGALYH